MKQVYSLRALLLIAWMLPALAIAADSSPVSLHARNESPQAVFEKLFGDMSLKVRSADQKLWEQVVAQPVTIDSQGESFWEVMEKLHRATGIAIAQVQGDQVLLVMDHGQSARQPSAIVEPLRASVIIVDAQSTIDFNNKKAVARDGLKARLLVEADPRCHAISIEPAEETDAQPRPNRRGNGPANAIDFIAGRATLEMDVAPAEINDGTGVIRGRYLLWYIEKSDPVEITIDGGRNFTQKEFGELQGTINVHPVGAGFGIDITLKTTTVDPQKWRALADAINASLPTLSDTAGNRYVVNGGHNAIATEDQITRTIQFGASGSQLGEPVKLSWSIPTKIDCKPIDIELNNVPLP